MHTFCILINLSNFSLKNSITTGTRLIYILIKSISNDFEKYLKLYTHEEVGCSNVVQGEQVFIDCGEEIPLLKSKEQKYGTLNIFM